MSTTTNTFSTDIPGSHLYSHNVSRTSHSFYSFRIFRVFERLLLCFQGYTGFRKGCRTYATWRSPPGIKSSLMKSWKTRDILKSRELRINIASVLLLSCVNLRTCTVGLHWSSSSCNSSTHWLIPELVVLLRPLFQYQTIQFFDFLNLCIQCTLVVFCSSHKSPVVFQTWKSKSCHSKLPYVSYCLPQVSCTLCLTLLWHSNIHFSPSFFFGVQLFIMNRQSES